MNRPVYSILWFVLLGIANASDAPKTAPVKDPELRAELLERAKTDQDVRGAVTKWRTQFGKRGLVHEAAIEASLNPSQKAELKRLGEAVARVDEENVKRLSEIVERHGWPTGTLVGREAAKAAWILVQHADQNPKFQRKCLDLMIKVARDEVSQSDLAYLTDRVLLAEGKKQKYGTQFDLRDGQCVPRPLEDEATVDARRKEVGLPPLADYLNEATRFLGGGSKE